MIYTHGLNRAPRSAWLGGPCAAKWAGGFRVRNLGPCETSIISRPILVLELDESPSRPGDGSQKAQRLWPCLTRSGQLNSIGAGLPELA